MLLNWVDGKNYVVFVFGIRVSCDEYSRFRRKYANKARGIFFSEDSLLTVEVYYLMTNYGVIGANKESQKKNRSFCTNR
jgi:hypothetical protein